MSFRQARNRSSYHPPPTHHQYHPQEYYYYPHQYHSHQPPPPPPPRNSSGGYNDRDIHYHRLTGYITQHQPPSLSRHTSYSPGYHSDYELEEYDDRDYDSYANLEGRKKKLKKKKQLYDQQDSQQQDKDDEEKDGEPKTDLERIAAKNAKRNERLSKLYFQEEEKVVVEKPKKLKTILKKKYIIQKEEKEDSEGEYEYEEEQIEQVLGLNQIMNSQIFNSPLIINEIQDQPEEIISNGPQDTTITHSPIPPPKDQEQQQQQQRSKKKTKKVWPFGFIKNLIHTMREEAYKEEAATYNPNPQPRMSFSTPIIAPRNTITPVLSPDNDSSLLSSSSTLTTPISVSPFEAMMDQDLLLGYWAVRVPSSPTLNHFLPLSNYDWLELDKENQKKIMNHFKLLTSLFGGGTARQNEYLEFCDSHFFNGLLPIAIAPLQKTCFVPLDMHGNQIARLPLAYIPRR